MVTRAELGKKRRRRVALIGTKGTGKTTTAVAIAREIVTETKKRVLYIDMGYEAGAVEELDQQPQEVLDYITHVQPRNFREAVASLTPGVYAAVVVDAGQHLRSMASDVAADVLILAGADKEETKGKKGDDDDGPREKPGLLKRIKDIDGVANPTLLPWGKGQGMLKEYERKFFERLWDMECDVVFSINTHSLSANDNYVEQLAGLFDVIVALDRAQVAHQKYSYRFVIEKYRGVEFTDASVREFKRGENILKRVDDLLKPKSKTEMMMTCPTCKKDGPMSAMRDCATQGHALAPRVVTA